MKILLPPSETKRPGGRTRPLDIAGLALPGLAPQREAVIDALVALAGDPAEARRVLGLSERQLGEVDHDRMLRTAPTMAAVDRYTGVLYDALDAVSLDAPARRWLGANVMIHSAPFGPVSALDAIPMYRLGAAASVPGIPPLRRHWAGAVSAELADVGFVLDLRSEAYVALGPIPASAPSSYVRVVTDSGRALNHFNKKSKGALVRALAQSRPRVRSERALLEWADVSGVRLRRTPETGVLELVVE